MSTTKHYVRDAAAISRGDRADPSGWRTVCSVCRRKGRDVFMGDLYITASGFRWARSSGRIGATERRRMGGFRVFPGPSLEVYGTHAMFFGRWGSKKTLTEADMPLRVRCQSGHHLNVLDVGAMFDLIDEADAAGRREVVIPE